MLEHIEQRAFAFAVCSLLDQMIFLSQQLLSLRVDLVLYLLAGLKATLLRYCMRESFRDEFLRCYVKCGFRISTPATFLVTDWTQVPSRCAADAPHPPGPREVTATVPDGRFSHTSALCGTDGRVFVFGGWSGGTGGGGSTLGESLFLHVGVQVQDPGRHRPRVD